MQHVPYIGRVPHPIERLVAPGGGREPGEFGAPTKNLGVIPGGVLGRVAESSVDELLDPVVVTPGFDQGSEVPLLLLLVGAPRVAGFLTLKDRAVGTYRQGPLGMRGREEQGQRRPAASPSQERGPFDAGGIHHRAHIVHPRLEIRSASDPVRHSRAPLVEVEHAHVLGQSRHEPGETRLLPVDLEVRHPAMDHDEGHWSGTQILVGDVGTVDRLGPAGLGDHTDSLRLAGSAAQGDDGGQLAPTNSRGVSLDPWRRIVGA